MNYMNCSNVDSKMIASNVDLSQENKDARLKCLCNDEENVVNIIDLLIKISMLNRQLHTQKSMRLSTKITSWANVTREEIATRK